MWKQGRNRTFKSGGNVNFFIEVLTSLEMISWQKNLSAHRTKSSTHLRFFSLQFSIDITPIESTYSQSRQSILLRFEVNITMKMITIINKGKFVCSSDKYCLGLLGYVMRRENNKWNKNTNIILNNFLCFMKWCVYIDKLRSCLSSIYFHSNKIEILCECVTYEFIF